MNGLIEIIGIAETMNHRKSRTEITRVLNASPKITTCSKRSHSRPTAPVPMGQAVCSSVELLDRQTGPMVCNTYKKWGSE